MRETGYRTDAGYRCYNYWQSLLQFTRGITIYDVTQTKRYIVHFPAGKNQQVNWSQKVVQPASELRNNDVTVFALGVTDDVNMKELETIVSRPTSNHVINMNNYDDLADAAHNFRRLICE